ncbi:exonuclease SbcCD subunit D C-terminal domain-containing protein [Capnocytophaga sp.]|uniref:exonuclease SbcCD subunit D C-terminal domain-containing protein n=1 Tax=Capnocytophaga sp. TaxID=44737 RepID=UPI0026DB0737|nr:exonuclease SbcCD subunit D C-terminal domain-containing protein [Capnocytophaga sp.]MDO5104928.1 exonuclease SbcCD subunit D C-terminal domain-containing protein [Capnocytophaga sp.]
MRILHTSDWHLGKTLYAKKERQAEHIAFLNWLQSTLKEQSIDILLIAGDVFDNATPSITSQKIYYDFLTQIQNTPCKNVIIVGGNHDSPNFLNAPKALLAALNITVIGSVTNSLEDEVILIKDSNLNPVMIICGVPFLRERDISKFTEKESYTDRSKRVNENIKKHYQEIATIAEQICVKISKKIPIIAMGHLSVIGGKRSDDDGVRETYIGNVEAISSDIFPKAFDYVALGHYHIPSVIKNHIRYCGSPIPMGFGEAKQKKCVYIIDFEAQNPIETIEIPVFQQLKSIIGDKEFIYNRLEELKALNTSVWVEIIYNGKTIFTELSSWVNEQVAHSKIEILKLQNKQLSNESLTQNDTENTLNQLNPIDVFERLLEKNGIAETQKQELKITYQEIVNSLETED